MVYLALHTNWDYEVYKEYDSEVEYEGTTNRLTRWMIYIDQQLLVVVVGGRYDILDPAARHIILHPPLRQEPDRENTLGKLPFQS
jgi:hypothetical protein